MQVGMALELTGGGNRRRTRSVESSPRARSGKARAIRASLNASLLQRCIEFTANSSASTMRQIASADCKVTRATLQVDIGAGSRYGKRNPQTLAKDFSAP